MFFAPLINWAVVGAVITMVAVVGGAKAWSKPTLSILFPIVIGIVILPVMLISAGFHKFDLFAVLHHIQFGMMDADYGIVFRSLTPLVGALVVFVLALFGRATSWALATVFIGMGVFQSRRSIRSASA